MLYNAGTAAHPQLTQQMTIGDLAPAAGCTTLRPMLKLSKTKSAKSVAKPAARKSGRKPSSTPQARDWADQANLDIASAFAGVRMVAIPKLHAGAVASK